MGALTLLATLLLPILAAPPTVATTGGPGCNAETIAIVDEALSKMRPERHHTFAFRGVAESCTLPPELDRGTRDMESAPPDRRAMLEAKTISASLPQWMDACPGGIETLTSLARMAPATRSLALWKQCNMARFGVPFEAVGKTNTLSPLGLVLAHWVHSWNPKASPRLVKALLIAPR